MDIGYIPWTYPVGACSVVHGIYPHMGSTVYHPRDIIKCAPRDIPHVVHGIKNVVHGSNSLSRGHTTISRGYDIDIHPRCRFGAYPVDYTYPVGNIPWATCDIQWATCDIQWVRTVDYTTPVGYIRGEHISRGYDIPWTTCTHGI